MTPEQLTLALFSGALMLVSVLYQMWVWAGHVAERRRERD